MCLAVQGVSKMSAVQQYHVSTYNLPEVVLLHRLYSNYVLRCGAMCGFKPDFCLHTVLWAPC